MTEHAYPAGYPTLAPLSVEDCIPILPLQLTIGPTSFASFGSGSTGGTTMGCNGRMTVIGLDAALLLPPAPAFPADTADGGEDETPGIDSDVDTAIP